MEIQGKHLTMKVINHLNIFPRTRVDSPSLGVFKSRLGGLSQKSYWRGAGLAGWSSVACGTEEVQAGDHKALSGLGSYDSINLLFDSAPDGTVLSQQSLKIKPTFFSLPLLLAGVICSAEFMVGSPDALKFTCSITEFSGLRLSWLILHREPHHLSLQDL